MAKVTDMFGKPVSGLMNGVVEAIVVDNVDPDQLGRVKVKFPLLPEAPESTWARLAMPMAGQERGWMTIPEIEDEVLVSFVRGDINNAVVVGSLYNGVDTPPYANEDEENNLRVFQSRSGHRLTFDDTEGAERIELILHNEEIQVIWDSANKVLSVYSGQDIIIEAKETISVKCTDFTLEASNNVSVKSGSNTTIEAGGNLNQEAGGTLSMDASLITLN
jgi:phage baseplate assembly protein V